MIATFIDRIIKREGGFVDHPDDRGGPTKYGISIYTLGSWRNEMATSTDIQELTITEAQDIYKSMYWEEAKLNELDLSPVLQEMLFDAAVQHDPWDATKWLQTSVGEKADGLVGPKTKAAVVDVENDMLAARFMAERISYYGRIITNNPSQATFAAGWMNRMKEFVVAIPAA
jgi:lysozyme family protein